MELPVPSRPPANASSPSSNGVLCPSAATFLFLPCAYTLLFVTALPANVLALWVFLRHISTMSPTHVYLSHLSISNLLLSLTTPFLAAYYAQSSVWTLDAGLCQLLVHGITPVLHINIYISLMILTWVALSRFATLIQHTHASRPSACVTLLPPAFFSRLKKASFASRVCVSVWVVAVGGIVPVTVYYSVNEAMKGAAGSEDGGAARGKELCYSPAVEIGGILSAAFSVPLIILFFVFYLLVLLSYVTVLRHIRRSHRNTTIGTSQSLLAKVFRNIVIIQFVLSVCLLPYHVFKPIFISFAHSRFELTNTPGDVHDRCHPFSTYVEVKNCLYLLAALRGSTDPVMYFLLDRTFRQQIFMVFGCKRDKVQDKTMSCSVAGRASQRLAQQQ
ncbi:probable G-protein coupled receptor 82 [Betta splendens]|uniref:Probable G-protein coupled receptor 82 n=1 Tax=Betta splendens TaxID=158456 RepID=A0A6P7LH90_BETSP|nr:probable G-protein coupled receptor 82 [Betta splendens]